MLTPDERHEWVMLRDIIFTFSEFNGMGKLVHDPIVGSLKKIFKQLDDKNLGRR